MKGGVFS